MIDYFEIAKQITREHCEKMGYPVPFEPRSNQNTAQGDVVEFHNLVLGPATVEKVK